MDAADCTCEEFSDGEDGHGGEVFLVREGDGVSDDDFFDGGVFEALDGGVGEDAMGGAAVDVFGTLVAYDAYGLGERAGGVDFVVYDDGIVAFDGADDAHCFGSTGISAAALFDDGKRGVEAIGESTCFFGEAFVGRDDGESV